MPEKEMKLIIKILGLIGAIFVLVAQFVPWAGGLYLFGADYGFYGGWDFFYIRFMGLGIWQFVVLGIMMIILFFLNLYLLITSFLKFKKFDSLGPQMYLKLGIFATVEFVLYIIAVNVGSLGLIGVGAYGIGFIMILIAMILFYVSYGMGKAFGMVPVPGAYQQPMYTQQPPTYTQPPPPPPPQPQQQPKQVQQASAVKKFCPNCGNPLGPNAKFCPSCGKQI